MKGKEYVQKVKNCILNRVRFHAPILFDTSLDWRALVEEGVDIGKPVFKFDKILNKNLIKAFNLAGREEDFNLLISSSSIQNKKQLEKLDKGIVFNPNTCKASFLEAINKLNINYSSSSNYNLVFREKFFKVQDNILNPHYEDFSLQQVAVFDEIFVQHCEFVLNGANFYTKLQNKASQTKRVALELNIPLAKGYYFFKRLPRSLLVENLLTKEKKFLNFICKGAKFTFSAVDGLENSVFSCINVKIFLNLKAGEEAFVFFNFGEIKEPIKSEKEVVFLKQASQRKCCEIFNLRVKTKNPKFDIFFNRTLPQKIWINWINGVSEQILEEKYVQLKNLFIKERENLNFVNFKEIGLKELGVFNGLFYKKILVVQSDSKFLKVGKTFFYNINSLSKQTLLKNDCLAVSFG